MTWLACSLFMEVILRRRKRASLENNPKNSARGSLNGDGEGSSAIDTNIITGCLTRIVSTVNVEMKARLVHNVGLTITFPFDAARRKSLQVDGL